MASSGVGEGLGLEEGISVASSSSSSCWPSSVSEAPLSSGVPSRLSSPLKVGSPRASCKC